MMQTNNEILNSPVWSWLDRFAHNYEEGVLIFCVILFAIVFANIFARLLVGKDE